MKYNSFYIYISFIQACVWMEKSELQCGCQVHSSHMTGCSLVMNDWHSRYDGFINCDEMGIQHRAVQAGILSYVCSSIWIILAVTAANSLQMGVEDCVIVSQLIFVNR